MGADIAAAAARRSTVHTRISVKEYLSEHFHKFLEMPEPPQKEVKEDGEHENNFDDLDIDVRDWHYSHEVKDRFRSEVVGQKRL